MLLLCDYKSEYMLAKKLASKTWWQNNSMKLFCMAFYANLTLVIHIYNHEDFT